MEGDSFLWRLEDSKAELSRSARLSHIRDDEFRVLAVKLRLPGADAIPVIVLPADTSAGGVWEGASFLKPFEGLPLLGVIKLSVVRVADGESAAQIVVGPGPARSGVQNRLWAT